MNMEYTEYMEKRHALEARMADMKMEARQKSRERSLLLEQQTSELRDRYFQEKRELESQCSADCEVIRHQYGTKKHDLFVQMGQLENEWRKTHPLPAAVINKAYELLMEKGGEA